MTTPTAKLAIVGLPGCGKTTLATALGEALRLPVLHTDVFKESRWAEQADAAYEASKLEPQLIVEGITVARMFKRGFAPDAVLWILGGRDVTNMRTLIDAGLALHSGRVITLPQWPSLDAALWALGTPEFSTEGRE